MGKPTYISWKPGYRNRIPAKDAYEELERIKKDHDGELTADILVEESRDKDSVLHPEIFDKGPKAAANEYYRIQARGVLRSIVFKIEPQQEVPVRAYALSVKEAEEEDEGSSHNVYLNMQDVMKDPEERKATLIRARAELKAFRDKYALLKELADVFKAIDAI